MSRKLLNLAILAFLTRSTICGAIQYSILDLGNVHIAGINNNNDVVGWRGGPYGTQAFLWRQGEFYALSGLGGPSAGAYDVNDQGEIVGYADTTGRYRTGKFVRHACYWQDGEVTDLGAICGESSYAVAINSRGDIAGRSADEYGSQSGVYWANGLIQRLVPMILPEDINCSGIVVGQVSPPTLPGPCYPGLWEGSSTTCLLTSGSAQGTAYGVNESGGIVGITYFPDGGRPFYWNDGKMTVLQLLPNNSWPKCSCAFGINIRGDIVGQSDGFGYEGFCSAVIWRNGSVIDLNNCVPKTPGLFLHRARRINDNGWIVCDEVWGHNFILKPNAIPASVDVKPGDTQNKVNLRSNGVLPVAILSDRSVQTANLDPSSIRLTGVRPRSCGLQDADGDGQDDLVLQFPTQSIGLKPGTNALLLTGLTVDGDPVEGYGNLTAF